jgi:hypothetical protein
MRSSPPVFQRFSINSATLKKAVFFLFAALSTSVLLCSCPARVRPVIALDEAFSATRPELTALIQDRGAFRSGLFSLFGRSPVLSVALTDGAGKAFDAAMAEGKRSGKPVVLVTSPLIAKAVVQGGSWSGDPALLVPEWRGSPAPGLWTATTDPIPAYRTAGSAAGAFIAALAKAGGSPSCGFIYSEAPTRPRAALAAFADAYADASEGRRLTIRELGGVTAAPAAQDKAPLASSSGAVADSSDISSGKAAEAAVAELLESDIRVLFIAAGPDTEAAIRSASRSGLAIGADWPYREMPRSLAFRIVPDYKALFRALVSEYRELGSPSGAGDARTVPALLTEGFQASSIRAGKLDFRRFLKNAALRDKSLR